MGPSSGEGFEVVGAEVLRDGVGCACRAESAAELGLRGTEVAFDVVAGWWKLRVIEASENVEPIARRDPGDVIDEVVSRRSESEARRVGPELNNPSVEARLRLERSRGSIEAVCASRDL